MSRFDNSKIKLIFCKCKTKIMNYQIVNNEFKVLLFLDWKFIPIFGVKKSRYLIIQK